MTAAFTSGMTHRGTRFSARLTAVSVLIAVSALIVNYFVSEWGAALQTRLSVGKPDDRRPLTADDTDNADYFENDGSYQTR